MNCHLPIYGKLCKSVPGWWADIWDGTVPWAGLWEEAQVQYYIKSLTPPPKKKTCSLRWKQKVRYNWECLWDARLDGTMCQTGLTRRSRSGQNQQLLHFGSEEATSGWMYLRVVCLILPGTDHKNLSVSSVVTRSPRLGKGSWMLDQLFTDSPRNAVFGVILWSRYFAFLLRFANPLA